MKSWPTRNSVPLHSLFYRCMQQTPNHQSCQNPKFDFKPSRDECRPAASIADSKLPLFIRQQIFDYFVRERIEIGADLICELLAGGGVNSFDFWSLCEINGYSDSDVCKIIDQLTLNADNLLELSIGGERPLFDLHDDADFWIALANFRLPRQAPSGSTMLV